MNVSAQHVNAGALVAGDDHPGGSNSPTAELLPEPGTTEFEFLTWCTNAALRDAIRNNRVTFPSQMVRLRSRADRDTSERIVQLYFISGWPVRRLCGRYRLSRTKIDKILNEWRQRAIAAGFVQEIQSQGTETAEEAPRIAIAGETIGLRYVGEDYIRAAGFVPPARPDTGNDSHLSTRGS
jgi:hypothetical protein